jgi:nicotinate-nucleotide pyrophosphorylase (carboxylating)
MIESIEEAILKIKRKLPGTPIEIEVENEADAIIAARLNVEIIMLDNFNPQTGKKVVRKIRQINPGVRIEVSGGITADNIEKYASFADRISLGYLTHSVKNKDFSLEIFKN